MTETLLCLNTETSLLMGEGVPEGLITECYGRVELRAQSLFRELYREALEGANYDFNRMASFEIMYGDFYQGDVIPTLCAVSGKGRSLIKEREEQQLNDYMDWLTKDYFWCNMVYGCNPSELAKMYSDLELKAVAVMLGSTNYYKGW